MITPDISQCFLHTKAGIGWSLESLKFIRGLKLCADHQKIVDAEVDKRHKDYLNGPEERVITKGANDGR